MSQRQLFLLNENKKKYSKTHTSVFKNGKKSPTADEILEDEHERFVEYVDLDFKKQNRVPVTDNEIRELIKKSFKADTELKFIEKDADDESYNRLIADIQQTQAYLDAINKVKEDIKIKRKTQTQTRKGIKLNEKYYYIVIKPHNTKTGSRVQAYRRFYSITTGKPIKTRNINRYIETLPTENKELTRFDKIKNMKKSKLSQARKKENIRDRLKRVRKK